MDKILSILGSLLQTEKKKVLETVEKVILPALVIKSSPVLNNKVWELIKNEPFLARSKIYTQTLQRGQYQSTASLFVLSDI